jgi:NAD(P)H-dependent FMN reductase
MATIKVIVGSVRPNRFGPKAAQWIMDLSAKHPEATFELVDLAEIKLPFLDEPQPPAAEETYVQEHTQAWAKVIGEADGFIFITPEYNHGVAPSLKNAIDFLGKEWYYKPVAFVSYGADAGGARSVEHLRGTAGWLRMYDLHDTVLLPKYWTQLGEDGAFTPTEEQTASADRMLGNIAFWADELKASRAKLAQ